MAREIARSATLQTRFIDRASQIRRLVRTVTRPRNGVASSQWLVNGTLSPNVGKFAQTPVQTLRRVGGRRDPCRADAAHRLF